MGSLKFIVSPNPDNINLIINIIKCNINYFEMIAMYSSELVRGDELDDW